jgi:hypothetical protein
MQRREYPLLFWSDIKSVIDNDQLELLGRSNEQQQAYNQFREKLTTEWNSVRDYLFVTKFGCETIYEGGKRQANLKEFYNSNSSQLALHLNDFSYNFEKGLFFVYFSLIT